MMRGERGTHVFVFVFEICVSVLNVHNHWIAFAVVLSPLPFLPLLYSFTHQHNPVPPYPQPTSIRKHCKRDLVYNYSSLHSITTSTIADLRTSFSRPC